MIPCRPRTIHNSERTFSRKRLNVYTNAMKAYFDIDEFRKSDAQYDWTLDQLSKLPIDWYGGADLSKAPRPDGSGTVRSLQGRRHRHHPRLFPGGSSPYQS